jgi:hypothetical protein
LRFYQAKYVSAIRKAMLYGVLTFALFAVNDFTKRAHGERSHFDLTIGLRFGTVALGLATILLSYLPRMERALMPIIALALFLFGAIQLVFGVLESTPLDPTYSGMALLIPSIAYSFFRLRFVFTVAVNWALFALFIALSVGVDTANATGANAQRFAVSVVLLFFALCIFSWYSYWREFFIRKGFLVNLNIKREERNHNRYDDDSWHTPHHLLRC